MNFFDRSGKNDVSKSIFSQKSRATLHQVCTELQEKDQNSTFPEHHK